jgi:hypothetical protein
MSHWHKLLAAKLAIPATGLTIGIKQNIKLETKVAIQH